MRSSYTHEPWNVYMYMRWGMQDADEPNPRSNQKHPQGVIRKLDSLHNKLHADHFYSKKELARGKLSAEGLTGIAHLFRPLLYHLSVATVKDQLLSIPHMEDPAFSSFVLLEVLRGIISFSLQV